MIASSNNPTKTLWDSEEVYRMQENIPQIKEGILTINEDGAFLVGAYCSSCNKHTFPFRPYCPYCFSGEFVSTTKLNTEGTLHSYFVSHIDRLDLEAPYAAGLVDLPEGIRLYSLLVDFPLDDSIPIGSKVELTVHVLHNKSTGERYITYAFRPSDE